MNNNEFNTHGHAAAGIPLKVFSEEKLRTFICKKLRSAYIPSSVYRLQFNRAFTFADAAAIVPYLHQLGVEAVYCSPYMQAAAGSMHGYNVVNPDCLNPELGSPQDYAQFCQALAQCGMGHIADVVPNHMGVIGNMNPWWWDVLENGPSSIYARYFDIDWQPVKQELHGKVLLPLLGNFYGRVLESQEITLGYHKGEFFVAYFAHRFPLDPRTYPFVLDDVSGSLLARMGIENQEYLEYLSVMTAFRNLPAFSETSIDKMLERNREKEIAKQRLHALAERSADVSDFINSRLSLFNGDRAVPKSFDMLDQLLNMQAYRLAFWSVASQEINYRRFFDINELAALRIEDTAVFRRYHDFLFTLIGEGKIDGLRIDHSDGLYDPQAYFRALQVEYLVRMLVKESSEAAGSGDESLPIDVEAARATFERLIINEFSSSPLLYVAAEKILDRNESLPENWNISGTVGYDYLNALNGLFIDSRNKAAFEKLYEHYIGHRIEFEELIYNKKKFIGLVSMASEINALGHRLDKISETNRNFRDFTRTDLTVAIREVIAAFPVYRTYVSPDSTSVSARDEQYIRASVARARRQTPALNPAVYDFLQDTLLLRLDVESGSEEAQLYRDFLLRFQQMTGPIMAKGVEDTSFYVYNQLISLNEVGGDPFYFGYTAKAFHAHNSARSKRWPGSMLATSTHDTKRSEDVRMRLDVLSEIPGEWKTHIAEWAQLHQDFKITIEGVAEPRRNTEYFIYQTLLGVWPDQQPAGPAPKVFVERIWQYVLKAIREAKIYTSWAKPDAAYENAVEQWLRAVLAQDASSEFWKSFGAFQNKLSLFGKMNSLSATLLKIASPGVVDIYQGNESWQYCLVDPDNRGNIDFKELKRLLQGVCKAADKKFSEIFSFDRDIKRLAQCKIAYTHAGLSFRRAHKELFIQGEYIPLEIKGARKAHAVAFMRRYGRSMALIVAGRFFTQWPLDASLSEYAAFWGATELVVPKEIELPQKLTNIITSEVHILGAGKQARTLKVFDFLQRECVCFAAHIEG